MLLIVETKSDLVNKFQILSKLLSYSRPYGPSGHRSDRKICLLSLSSVYVFIFRASRRTEI